MAATLPAAPRPAGSESVARCRSGPLRGAALAARAALPPPGRPTGGYGLSTSRPALTLLSTRPQPGSTIWPEELSIWPPKHKRTRRPFITGRGGKSVVRRGRELGEAAAKATQEGVRLAPPAGLEPAASWSEARRSVQLSYGGARPTV